MTTHHLPEELGSSDIQAVTRVGHVFSLFSAETGELTAADIADQLGLNRTTVYRYCVSLVSAGLLERGNRRGTFVLGGVVLQLGILALGRRRVVDLAPPHLERANSGANTSAILSLWGSNGSIVTRVDERSDGRAVVTVRVGTQLGLWAAQTRVFMAYLPDRISIDRLLAEYSASDRAAIEIEFEQIRRDGICIVNEPDGLVGAAVPVFDEYGICATFALLGTSYMADFTVGSDSMNTLGDAADALTAELGGRGRRST